MIEKEVLSEGTKSLIGSVGTSPFSVEHDVPRHMQTVGGL